MNEWQPISTAPKDGTPIIAAKIGVTQEDLKPHFLIYPETVRWLKTEFSGPFGFSGFFPIVSEHYMFEPTHWMPLPEPPKE